MRTRTKHLLRVAGALAAVIGAVGVLHMPFAHTLLMRAGGCPVGRASLAEIEPARNAAILAARGTSPAPARPALGFELDRTTRANVVAWAERFHVSCDNAREGLVRCKDVPASALGLPDRDGPVGELHLGFDTRGNLVDVSTMRTHLAIGRVRDIASKLDTEVGGPDQQSGDFDPTALAASGAASLSSARYRYRDYFADVIAMRFATDGLVLREHFASPN
jgi:hypothetical protein